MTEQERPPRTEPTTEAGRSIIGHDYRGNEVYTITREGVIAIEEAARTEGRQQAVDLLREWIEHHQPEGYDGIQDCSDINDRTERWVAGLNASESGQPPEAKEPER